MDEEDAVGRGWPKWRAERGGELERDEARSAKRDEGIKENTAEGFRRALIAEANLARHGFTLVAAATVAGLVVVSVAAEATPLAAWLLGAFLVVGVTLAIVTFCRLLRCCDRDELKALGDPHGSKRAKTEVMEQSAIAVVSMVVTIIIGLFALLVMHPDQSDRAALAAALMAGGGCLGLIAVFWIVWHSLDQLTSNPEGQPEGQLPRAMP